MPLYPHQEKVRHLLEQGHNVILQAPTGAGKTRAAIEPFLHSVNLNTYGNGGFLPPKLIYSVPMRVLAKQFNIEYENILNTFNKRKGTALRKSIQTGEMPQDPELTHNLIFATIDQTISSFLMAPYGLSRGRANLNLGAILSSYLVFDEFHLYDPDSTLPTVLQMLRMLNGITPFVLMTATFSHELITRLADKLSAEVVGLGVEDRESFARLKSQNKIRRYHASTDCLTPEIVLAQHQGRSIVICNTVQRARAMAHQLKNHEDIGTTEVILLHSQFLREDRDCIEKNIRKHFGRDKTDHHSVIVVATQTIEVGVDITSTVMHTELAPANAIIQRAGRCARYENNEGDVYVYRYVQNAEGEVIDLLEKPNPYGGTHAKAQMSATFHAFQDVGGDPLTFDDEQQVIDCVHSDADRQILNDLDADSAGHRTSMFTAMRGDADHVGDLVRKVIAQPVTIHAQPEQIKHPFRMPSFSLHPGVLRGFATTWIQNHFEMDDDTAPPFAVKYLVSETDPDDSRRTLYKWECIHESAAAIPYGTLVVVHPALASYSKADGFNPYEGGGWEEDPTHAADDQKDRKPHTYKLETYAEHIQWVYKAAFLDNDSWGHRAYWHELEWAAHRLAQRMNITLDKIREAAELTVLLHDVGKLSTGWQQWVRKYQEAIGEPVDSDEAYAHTHYDPVEYPEHEMIQSKMGKRPPHAVESAVAVAAMLAELPEVLKRPVFTAICRHHGAFTDRYRPIRLEKYATDKVAETLQNKTPQLLDGQAVKVVPNEMFITPEQSQLDGFFTYAVFARLLRHADNKGTMWGTSSYKD